MAKWKETLEPYVKVIESVRTVPSNPTAGEDLIVGAVIISDSGPATPTLITSQREFLRVYSAEDLTQDYTDSLNELYTSDPGSPLASTMWLNAYRLAGSTHMLVCRASKAKDLVYAKPIAKGDLNQYVLKNTEVLKRVDSFKFVLDRETIGYNDGWAINVTDIGIIGNKVTDDGPVYDYKVDTLTELVDLLNDSTKFFSPDYSFYTDPKCTEDSLVEGEDLILFADDIVAVKFNEVYLGQNFLDQTTPIVDEKDNETGEYVFNEDGDIIGDGNNDYWITGGQGSRENIEGMSYILAVDPNWENISSGSNMIIDLNAKAWSGFDEVNYYATNLYNSRSDLQVRIRRFNHNAVVQKVTSDVEGTAPESPYIVSTKVLDKYTSNGTKVPKEAILKYDFYEFAIFDPDISDDWEIFNVGNIGGRGDITIADLNDNLSMMHLKLPDNLLDLDLNYYGYNTDNYEWVKAENAVGLPVGATVIDNTSELPPIRYKKSGKLLSPLEGTVYAIVKDQHYSLKKVEVQTDAGWNLVSTGVTNLDPYELAGTSTSVPETGDYTAGALWAVKTSSGPDTFSIYEYVAASSKVLKLINDDIDTEGLGSYEITATVNATPSDLSTYEANQYIAVKKNSKSIFDTYKLTPCGLDEISLNLSLKRTNSVTGEVLTTILDVSDNDIMQAWDRIEEDERYIVEGMTDLGNTYSIIQNYMANIAVNSNYFYAVSTINSTNYMTIANKKQKITKNAPKLYFLSPWDYDDGTVGYLFNASPSVLYWECISRNRSNNNWFAPAFGQTTGIVTPVNLATDFKKSERQLLLTKKINTVFYDINIDRIYINDSYTATTDDNIRKEENIERAIIHISKAMPTLLKQFKGRINSSRTRKEVEAVIDFWFKFHMIPISGDLIDEYRIICDETETLNPPEEQRANRLNVCIQTRFLNSIKFITVFNQAFPIGVEFDNDYRK